MPDFDVPKVDPAAGRQAEKFLERAAGATEGELQHLMARVTGIYKRGNERKA